MSDVVVKYRPRSVSKFVVVLFVVLLLIPTLIALISVTAQLIQGKEGMTAGKLVKTLLFAGGLCVVVFRPAGRIMIDRQAGTLRHAISWSTKAATEFPLLGLAAVFVETNPAGSLHRLVLAYKDGSKQPLTENFFYDLPQHEGVALALNAAIAAHAASADPRLRLSVE
ncbi:MAG TPA: hypothetical protein VER11_09540 [Polyangiaceae bacterium]|nr:hypothetical protein [Polyangiaceae bacterium]